MRAVLIGFMGIMVLGVVFAACSPDFGSAATGSSGTGVAPDCKSVSIGDDQTKPCNICIHGECCAQQAECLSGECLGCLIVYHPDCDPKVRALMECMYHCVPSCYPGWPAIEASTTGGSSGTGGTSSSSGGTGGTGSSSSG
jgi:uncharacterized membrane protein YgcG